MLYPFGYGLSYTDFTQEMENFSDNGDTVSFDVKVTNTGGAAGKYAFIKHFVLNDQETNRCAMLLTYTDEQPMREIYLKPFEMSMKHFEGNSLAVMSSFNFIGDVCAGANPNLLMRFFVMSGDSAEWFCRTGTVLMDIRIQMILSAMEMMRCLDLCSMSRMRLRIQVLQRLYLLCERRARIFSIRL